MTLRDSYQRFLDNPSAGALAESASLHYISTLTSIHDASAILKHLSVQEKLLEKTGQKIVDAVEGVNGLSVDVETTIAFNNGGGAYLPGLDDNFVADRTVTFPMVHMVHFDHDGKIVQMRQYWDQGSLLKQIDVIGARSRNWPIRDGRDQAKLVAKTSAGVGPPDATPCSGPSAAARGGDEVSINGRGRGPTNVTNDPHASLSLFRPREVNEDVPNGRPIAPRALSAKPPPREYSELFVGANATSPSPEQIPVKGGGGTNFKSNRLFDDTEDDQPVATPSIKMSANKFNHFDFGGDDDTPKNGSTSSKGRSSNNGQGLYQDHITGTTSDDADNNNTRQQPSHRAHKATNNNFDFYEESPKTRGINIAGNGMGNRAGTQFSLFDDGEDSHARKAPVSHTREQHGDGMGGRKDTPSQSSTTKPSGITIAGNGMGNRAGTQFSLFDDDEESHARKAPVSHAREQHGDGMGGRKDTPSQSSTTKTTGITIAGNGMGNRAGTQFSLFDDETPVKNENLGREQHGDGMGGRKGEESYSTTQFAKKENVHSEREQHGDGMGGRKDGGYSGINISGNGMGNRKGTQFSLFDEESPVKKNENLGRAQHGDGMGGRKDADSFWDY